MQIQINGHHAPRDTTLTALLTHLAAARTQHQHNAKILELINHYVEELNRSLVITHPTLTGWKRHGTPHDTYMAALNLAIMAIRFLEEGDACLHGYAPPDLDAGLPINADDFLTWLYVEGN